MTTVHLTEREIQLYVADKDLSDAQLINHIGSCPFCQSRIRNYEQLFNAIHTADKPAFDFDLSLSVLESLPAAKSSFPWTVAILAILLSIGLIGITILFFWSPLLLLIKGASGILCVVLGLCALGISVFQVKELTADHQKRMNMILIQQ